MDNSDVKYDMKELLPVISHLAEMYTGCQSTSVTYETAAQLMEAVIYCIREGEAYGVAGENEDGSTQLRQTDNTMSAMEAYELGYETVLRRMREASAAYAQLMQSFHDYGNTACRDTVAVGIPLFFQRYDARFCPQDHLLTLDYPILEDLSALYGIDAISRYINCICAEQRFLQGFSQQEVYGVLIEKHSGYEEMFLNLSAVVLRKLLGCMLLGRGRLEEPFTDGQYAELKKRVEDACGEMGRAGLESCLEGLLKALLYNGFAGDEAMFSYLKGAVPDFAVELLNGLEYDCLPQVL